MNTNEQKTIRQAPEDPFLVINETQTDQPGFSPSFLGFLGILMVAGFFAVGHFHGGFSDMRQYGVDENGSSHILSLSDDEKLFMIALLLLLPATAFLTLAFEEKLPKRVIDKLSEIATDENLRRKALIGLTVATLAVTVFIAYFILKGGPVSDDENIYLFQARIFKSGRLALESLPAPDRMFNDNVFLVNDGRMFGQYPFGHSFFLLPGLLVGLPRLLILLAAALTVPGIFLLARQLYDSKTGMLAAVLLAASPMFLCMSSTMLSHSLTMAFLTWGGVFALRTMKSPKILNAFFAGLFLCLSFHIRSATTIMIAAPAGVVFAAALFFDFDGEKGKKPALQIAETWPRLGVFTAVSICMAALYLLFNYLVNGSPFVTNYHAAWLGKLPFDSPFGFDRGAWNIIHTPEAGLNNLINSFFKLNIWLFGWPLSFIAAGFLFASRKARFIDWLLLTPVLLTFAAYFFYFWPGISDTGPVLYYELLLPLVLLSARGIMCASSWFAQMLNDKDRAAARMALFTAISVLLAVFSTTQIDLRALAHLSKRVREPYEFIRDRGIDEGLIFMDYYVKGDAQDSWVAGRDNTDPRLGDKLHFVLNYGRDLNEKFRDKYFPDKKAYVLWWEEDDPRLVDLEDYTENYVVKNYFDSR